MQVSGAAVITAHQMVFGTAMPSDKPFTQAAQEIKAACAHWATLMKCCEAVKGSTDDAGKYLPYEELAKLAGQRLDNATRLEFGIDAFTAAQADGQQLTRAAILERMAKSFDRLGPYAFAKKFGVLLNNSGEEFACQFMAAYNAEIYRRY